MTKIYFLFLTSISVKFINLFNYRDMIRIRHYDLFIRKSPLAGYTQSELWV